MDLDVHVHLGNPYGGARILEWVGGSHEGCVCQGTPEFSGRLGSVCVGMGTSSNVVSLGQGGVVLSPEHTVCDP